MEQTFLHTHYYPVSLPDRCSTGPAIPGAVSHQSGDYRTTNLLPCWPVRSYREPPECRYCPNYATTDIPGITRLSPPSACRVFPNRSLFTFTHNRVFTKMSGLSAYCCSTCQGFHRTAVICVRAAVLLLSELYTNRFPMDLTNYPPNTIIRHFYLELNNTFYLLTKTCIRLSQDRSNN